MFCVKFAEKEISFDAPLSVFDAAKAAELVIRAHIAARVNGKVVDMTTLLDADATVELLTFDNADDFVTSSEEFYSTVAISVEANLQGWAGDYNAMYKKISNNRYMIIFRDTDVDKMISQRFPILKNIRSIGTARHIPTISVGLARGCKTVHDSEIAARKALEMSLGRGGDQAAILKNDGYEFFGGVSKGVEKRSKARTRIVASAIQKLMENSSNIFFSSTQYWSEVFTGSVAMRALRKIFLSSTKPTTMLLLPISMVKSIFILLYSCSIRQDTLPFEISNTP